MEILPFAATIYLVNPKFIKKLEESFNQSNFYRQKITLPNKGYKNPQYRQTITNLKKQLWNDVLVQLADLFEKDTVYDIEDRYNDFIKQFVLKHYEPSEELKNKIELEASTVLEAILTAQNNTLSERIDEFNKFKHEVKSRIHTSLEHQAANLINESLKIPNPNNIHEIKFKLEFKKATY